MIKRPGSWLLALLLFAAVCLLVSCGDSAPSDPGYDYDSDGHWYKGGEENKTAHTFDETVIPPTCTESGYTLHRCVCGYSYESDPAKPLGHTFSDTLTYDETGHWYPAVCGHADEKKDYAPHCYYTEVNKGPTCHPPVMVRTENEINLIVNIVPWNTQEVYDRLGLEEQYMELLGVKVPMNTIPITPGRNLAMILEVAAMNNRQKKLGYNAALEFTEQVNQHFDENMGRNT